MSQQQQRWWHGTTSAKKARSIIRDGFRKKTWFARHLEDALAFGGRHVFEVGFTTHADRRPHRMRWQVCLSNALPASAIFGYRVYSWRDVKGRSTWNKVTGEETW